MAKQLGFYFDSSVCSGCKACQLACKDKHNLNIGVIWRRVYEISGGDWIKKDNLWEPNIFVFNLSIACNHCENPVCRNVCPTGAIIKRDDGIVLVDRKKCMGCRYCEWACPYSAPQYDESAGVMSKCHFCYDLIDRGEPPACVTACPMRALDFNQIPKLQKKYQGANNIYPMPDAAMTKPAIVIKPHKDATRAKGIQAKVTNIEEVRDARE